MTPCYFGAQNGYATPVHPGTYRSCCGVHLCDQHANDWAARIPAAAMKSVKDLASWALGGIRGKGH